MYFFDLENLYPNLIIKKNRHEKFKNRKTEIPILS